VPINLPGATVDVTGKVTAVGIAETRSRMTKEHFDKIRNCDEYIIRVNTQTSTVSGNSPFVKVYTSQLIMLKVGADAKFKYTQKL